MVSSQRLLYRLNRQQRPSHLGMICALIIVFGLYSWYKGHQPIERKMEDLRMSNLDILARMSKNKWNVLREGEVSGLTPPMLERTLVIYNVHHDIPLADSTHLENLQFFFKIGIGEQPDPHVDYIFLVPAAGAHKNAERERNIRHMFPSLPNVRVLDRPDDCLGCSGLQDLFVGSKSADYDEDDGMTDGFLLNSLPLNLQGFLSRYTHFLFLDSSVRGPFLPRYTRPRSTSQVVKPWTDVFTKRLGPQIKLVGRTVSCEIEMHVQAPAWATDRVGLQLLLEHGVLDCATDPAKARRRHELAATRVILGEGYRVDCLMLRYQGVDLTQLRELGEPCMARDNPSLPFLNDGLPINPLEVVFVLTTPQLLASDPLLRRYTDYLLGRVGIQENEITTERGKAVLEARRLRLAAMVADCGATLDLAHLSSRCPGCMAEASSEEIQKRFIEQHALHGYDYRFTIVETDVNKLHFHYCESFLRYQAPNLTS